MGVLTIGTQALQANLMALQVTGNNIANANTPGYSTQQVILSAVQGQFSGSGYVGKGVSVETVTRSFDAFLTRQATLSGSVAAADTLRADYLKQISSIFQGGPEGMGAAINDMMNAFSDVASSPTDMTARTVLLARVEEAARRMRTEPMGVDDLLAGLKLSLKDKVQDINTFAKNIADTNEQISRALGQNQPPNDLLDRRDYLIASLNKLVQTSQVRASDGTIGVFIGGSHCLVLGNAPSRLVVTGDAYDDVQKNKIAIVRDGEITTLDENTLGGGEVPALLKVQNNDMVEARNLVGRISAAVISTLNQQHRLGIDLNGKPGGDLLHPVTSSKDTVLVPRSPANPGTNAGAGTLGFAVSVAKDLVPSDYEISFSTTTGGTVRRTSDGTVTQFAFTPGTTTARGSFAFQTETDPATGPFTGTTIDGLKLDSESTTAPGAGAQFLVKPYSAASRNVGSVFSSASALAVGSPLAATITPTNKGSLAVAGLLAKTTATSGASPIPDFTVQFTVTGAGTSYSIINTSAPVPPVVSGQPYASGQEISYTPAGAPGFSLKLTGVPANSDTVTVKQNAYASISGGNATALMDLRDALVFDGATMTDGYASMIAQIGVRSQSASYTAEVSGSIASNAEKNRSGVSGVNLDEEAAKLLQYQQAYQASAKMIQISQNIFDTLLQGMGR